MLDVSKSLFSRWNDAQLSYCHWKSNEHLMAGLEGDTDLDVLLSLDDKERGEKILHKLDFLQCKSQFGSRYPGVEDWIGFDNSTGKLIHLHLHYHLVTGHKGLKEYDLPWTSDVLATRIMDKETSVYISSPDIELVTLYTRMALKISLSDIGKKRKGKYTIDNSYLVEIAYLKEKVNWVNVEKIVFDYYQDDAQDVLAILKKEKLHTEDVFQLKHFSEKTFRKVSRHKYTNRLLEYYYKYALKYRKFLRHKLNKFIITRKVPQSEKGLLVAFLGQDGAGKTTVTNIIRKWWSWKMDVQYIYLGSGDNYHSWRKTLYKRLPNSSIFKAVKAWLQLSKYKKIAKDSLSLIKAGEKFSSKGGLVIFDRYPQVQFPGISDGPKIRSLMPKKLPKVFKMILERFAAKEEQYLIKTTDHCPDIVFKLVIPPEESVRRKPENVLETMIEKHNLIKALQFEGSNVYEIDAMMPLEKELLMIKQTIWQHIQK